MERMAIGMIYHSGQEDRVLDIYNTENGRLLFTPRLYTSDNFSSTLVIDNFNSLPSYETRGFIFSTHTNLAEYKGIFDRLFFNCSFIFIQLLQANTFVIGW